MPSRHPCTVRRRAPRAACAAAALWLALAGPAPPARAGAAPSYTDADYWAFADRSMSAFQAWWSPNRLLYVEPGRRTASMRVNAGMLAVHAIAALHGHGGPARQDARAAALAQRLLTPPASFGRSARASSRTVCWSGTMDSPTVSHASVDPKVADALAWAWQARDVLRLPPETVQAIVRQVDACARHRYWAFPPAVANQVNWNAELYAAAARVTGQGDLLRGAYRRHLGWFAGGITRPPAGMRTTNLGPGYQFHYFPLWGAGVALNFDSPEYANLAVQVLEHYDEARLAGMAPLPGRSEALLRAWVKRLVAGAWTHAGFLNWDTGYGDQRRYSAQYWAFAQQGLIAIAASPHFRSARYGRWAKGLLDRGLELYTRWGQEAGTPHPPARLFGVRAAKESDHVYHVRMLLNAARAVALGLGRVPGEDPPPLYAFDLDTGRLAVTTPRYSTAVVPDNRGAFPYGGIELARLFGPGQRVAANVGGVPPAAFGVILEDARGRRVLASQRVRARPLRILDSPHGRLTRPRGYPAQPYAGPFETLRARGEARGGGARVVTEHSFSPYTISSRWSATCRRGRCARARVMFPTWGADAAIDVLLDGGTVVRLAGEGTAPGAEVRLADVRAVRLGAGYAVDRLHGPEQARLVAHPVRAQSGNPQPGPALAVELPAPSGSGAAALAARIVPATRRDFR